jgi:hypothetical protein
MSNIKLILPKPFKPDALINELKKGVRETQRKIQQDFQGTTEGWKHEVKFTLHNLTVNDKEISGATGTKDKIYRYVSQGTEPHIIRAKPGKTLRFFPGYSAKTRPNSIVSGGGGGQTDVAVFRQEVHHPGNDPRNFPQTIARLRNADFKRRMKEALKIGAKRARG